MQSEVHATVGHVRSIYMCVYISVCMYIQYVCVYMYVYIYLCMYVI